MSRRRDISYAVLPFSLPEHDPEPANGCREYKRKNNRNAALAWSICRILDRCRSLKREISNTLRSRRWRGNADHDQNQTAQQEQQSREVEEVDGCIPRPHAARSEFRFR